PRPRRGRVHGGAPAPHARSRGAGRPSPGGRPRSGRRCPPGRSRPRPRRASRPGRPPRRRDPRRAGRRRGGARADRPRLRSRHRGRSPGAPRPGRGARGRRLRRVAVERSGGALRCPLPPAGSRARAPGMSAGVEASPVTRRSLLHVLALAGLGAPRLGGAEGPGKVARVGFVSDGQRSTDGGAEEGLRQGLRELEHVEDVDILTGPRYAEERPDRLPPLVNELIRLPVDVLVTLGGSSTRVAREATRTTPIVAASGVLAELASLTRPGGNVTGIALPQGPADI